ncbi:DNA-directed RNA polymerase II core subunit rpo21 [Basidiobolus ranarum]|uniref:DNA-directed RNA polymerase n=1 Tax=Basidiobolus ranarum TaxID=34480 RepID=A0ABR2VIZ0_9FUNG
MVSSGAKGNNLNLTQISQQLGQQYMYGEPVKCQLPYKYFNDLDNQLQNGYINSSYVKGLNPYEFFVHQMAAREGIVNTGVSTASTGYLNRRACKLMGDVKVMYNNTIGTDNCTIRILNDDFL